MKHHPEATLHHLIRTLSRVSALSASVPVLRYVSEELQPSQAIIEVGFRPSASPPLCLLRRHLVTLHLGTAYSREPSGTKFIPRLGKRIAS